MSEPQYIDHWVWVSAEEPVRQPAGTHGRVNVDVMSQAHGDSDGARQELQLVLEREPDIASALSNVAADQEPQAHPEQLAFRLGYVCFRQGNFLGAIQAFETCLIEQPDWGAARLNLSLAQWRSGDPKLAAATLQGALTQNTDTLRLRANLAIDEGEWRTAQDLEAQLLEAGENTSALTYNIGVLQQRAGLLPEAVPSYQRALEQNQDFAEAWLNLGHAFKALGRDGEAQSAWVAALAAKPELSAGYFKPVLEAGRQQDCPPCNSADTIGTSR